MKNTPVIAENHMWLLVGFGFQTSVFFITLYLKVVLTWEPSLCVLS